MEHALFGCPMLSQRECNSSRLGGPKLPQRDGTRAVRMSRVVPGGGGERESVCGREREGERERELKPLGWFKVVPKGMELQVL